MKLRKALLALFLSVVLIAGEALPFAGAIAETGVVELENGQAEENPTDPPANLPEESEPTTLPETPTPPAEAEPTPPAEAEPTPSAEAEPTPPAAEPTQAPEPESTASDEPSPIRIEAIAFEKAEVAVTLSDCARGLDFARLNSLKITPEDAVREGGIWSVRKKKDGPLDDSVAAFVDYDKNGEKLEGDYAEDEIAETRFEVYQAGEIFIRLALKSDPSIYGEFKLVILEDEPEAGESEPLPTDPLPIESLPTEEPLRKDELTDEARGESDESLLTEELLPQNELSSVGGDLSGAEDDKPRDLIPAEQISAPMNLSAPMGNAIEAIAVAPASLSAYVGDALSWTVSLEEALFADSTIPEPAVNGASIALKADGTGYEAVAPGVSTVTYVKMDLNGQPQSATITILVSEAPSETIQLSRSELYLNPGEAAELSYTLDTRLDAPLVQYATSDSNVAAVDETGRVSAVAVGNATITATFTDWNNVKKSAACLVKVGLYPTGIALAEGVESEYLLPVGGEQQLQVVASFPEGTAAGATAEIRWSSGNESVAMVDETGKVTAMAPGEAMIATSTINGRKLEVRVWVGAIAIERPEGPNILLPGETVSLEAATVPEALSVVWRSSAPAVATVDESGLVTAVGAGTAIITAYATEEGNPIFGQIEVAVSPLEPAEGLARSVTLAAGGEGRQLSLKALPEEFAGATVSWLSSNPEVADVTDGGLVTGVSAGTAEVTATLAHGGASYALDFEITVISVEISTEGGAATVARGKTLSLSGSSLPDDYPIEWSSSDVAKATVDANGLVTGVATGEVVITAAITVDGVRAAKDYPLLVTVPAETIAISGAEFDENNRVELYSGRSLSLTFALTPQDTTDAGQWVWEEMLGVNVQLSEDQKTATVSATVGEEDGAMLIEDGTEFVLTVQTSEVSASRTIVFRQAVSFVEITGDKVEEEEQTHSRLLRLYTSEDSSGFGPSAQLSARLLPEGAALSGITWSTSDAAIATVDATGLATAVAYGSATIRATAENGVYGEILVTVRNRAEYITLDPTYIKVDRYDQNLSHKINARTYPEGADELFWSSSDETIATVDQEGNVTCLGSGIAVIRARTSDTDPSAPNAIALVNVVQHVNEIRLHTDPFPDINSVGLTVAVSQTVSLGITLLPEGATDKGFTMVAADPSILTVAGDKMRGAKAGTTSVIITALDASDGTIRSRTLPVRVVAKGKGVTSLKLNKSSISLLDGQSYRVKATVSSRASVKGVRYYSEDTNVCVVDPSNGTVTATGIGETYVHCIASSGLVKSCKVAVVPQRATSVRFTNAKNGTMRVGETYQLEAECLPSTITFEEDKVISNWVTSNPSVAIVNDEGLLYCVSAGTTYVYAQATSGKYARIKLTVKDQTAAGIQLVNTSTNPNGVLYVGGAYRMRSELFLGNAVNGSYYELIDTGYDAVYYGYGTNPNFGADVGILLANLKNSGVVWGSSNKKVATVDYDTGVISCLKSGTFDLLCASRTNTKKIYRLKLTVTVPASYDYANALQLLDESGQQATVVTMTYGDPANSSHKLSYSLNYQYPLEAEWFSDDERVATVDQNGLVTATGIGETTIGILVGGFDYREVKVRVERQDGTTDVTYRNLTITMYQKPGERGYLSFMKNSSALIRSSIAGQEVDGHRYDMAYYTNAQVKSKSNFVSAIRNAFSGTKEGDVSVIVLMSHGTISNGNYRWHLSGTSNYKLNYISGTDIVSTIKQYVKGHVVVVLLSCFSGASTPASSLGAQIRALDASLTGGNSVSLITSTDGNTQSGFFNTSEYIAYDFFSVGVAETIAANSELTVSEFGSLTKSNTASFLALHKATYGSSSIGMNQNPVVQLFISDKAKDVVVF